MSLPTITCEAEMEIEVLISRGVVQNVYVNGEEVYATILDEDIDGCDPETLTRHPLDPNREVYVYTV